MVSVVNICHISMSNLLHQLQEATNQSQLWNPTVQCDSLAHVQCQEPRRDARAVQAQTKQAYFFFPSKVESTGILKALEALVY